MSKISMLLRSQTIYVHVSHDDVSLQDQHGNPIEWQLTDDEWLAILAEGASEGYETDDWYYPDWSELDDSES